MTSSTSGDPTGAASDEQDIPLRRVKLWVCDLCMTGAGGECHVPGCSFWCRNAPTGDALAVLHFAWSIRDIRP